MKRYWVKARIHVIEFVKSASEEAKETSEAAKILRKYAQTKSISPEEKEQLRLQIYDILKSVGIHTPFNVINKKAQKIHS